MYLDVCLNSEYGPAQWLYVKRGYVPDGKGVYYEEKVCETNADCKNDNAPVLQMSTDEKYFSFVVKTEFDTKVRYDQSGIVMYLDSENWLKASVEYENDKIQRLGSVVTNNGYSDWASVDIDASQKSIWFRLSRRESDFCIENSIDGIKYNQMRICHMHTATERIPFGIYACSAENSSFKATFTNMEMTECQWLPHDGQAPDEEIQ